MSNQTRQGVPEFTPIGNVEHERREALRTLLDEVNDVLAYLEDETADVSDMAYLALYKRLEIADRRCRAAWGWPEP